MNVLGHSCILWDINIYDTTEYSLKYYIGNFTCLGNFFVGALIRNTNTYKVVYIKGLIDIHISVTITKKELTNVQYM